MLNEVSKITTRYGEIVYKDRNYIITMDKVRNGVHMILLYEGRQVGLMNVAKTKLNDNLYYEIRGINISPEHRSKGYGSKMYHFLIERSEDEISGLISKKSRIANQTIIPKIHEKFDTVETDKHIIINFNYDSL